MPTFAERYCTTGTGRTAAGQEGQGQLLAPGRGRRNGHRSGRGDRRAPLALYLLFDLPLIWGGLIAQLLVSLGLLAVQNRKGRLRPGVRAVDHRVSLSMPSRSDSWLGCSSRRRRPPTWRPAWPKRFDGLDSVSATAMLGATVMPHVVYLHSALTRDRFGRVEPGGARRRLLSATKTDVLVAMMLAGSVNVAMLLLAASRAARSAERRHHRGRAARRARSCGCTSRWGCSPLGLASTSVGCYAGSVIMEGLLRVRVNLLSGGRSPWCRR